MEADILTPEEQKAVALRGATEAAAVARERYGIDLARVARDPGEALALVRAYAADALLDPTSNRMERGSAATLLLNSIGQKERGTIEAKATKRAAGPRALFGGPVDPESAVG